ncbi:MAG TPA: TIGR03885 family FMN-dependent LLM class oxidoreductase [Microlunatus sp.]|jgi:probable non-F420 flavinoid oxidoreductase|nr:TIGR03885 family FMN-dependent LLM class oxidoreductase [Microlunatus sp.]
MVSIGFHASHEQIGPTILLQAAQRAEQAGFDAAMCSDHFSPWSARQGHSGFAWTWLGSALEATSLPFGVVSAPGQRYHPAILAQAISTVATMYEGRFWVALGSGEASNEHITGDPWPRKDVRNARLAECVAIIRALLDGEEVTHDGLVTVDRARLWSRPDVTPALIGPAVTEATAGWVASWADGLATINQPHDTLRTIIDAYRSAGGAGPLILQVHLSVAATEEEAKAIAYDQWRSNVFPPPICWDLDSVEAFDTVAERVRPDDMAASVRISAAPGQHAEWLQEYVDLGFDQIYLHHVGQHQDYFIDTFGERVLPQLRSTSGR